MQAVPVREEADAEVTDDALFEQLYPSLRRFAAVADPFGDPDDLVQEAVAQALRRQPLNALEHPGAYLRRSVLNLASNRRRGVDRWRIAAARHGRSDDASEPHYASDVADLLRLAPDARALLWLVEVEGWDYAEAGAQLGMSEGAARQRAARARRRLRMAIEGDD